jgi:hypothetical protein
MEGIVTNKLEIGKKALITTDNWFVAPDGNKYQAVFGTIRGIKTSEQTLGIKPNSRSTNWYIEIGNMIVAGCQIHFAIRTDDCSKTSSGWSCDAQYGCKVYECPTSIYFSD